ncbi:hypothetical protein [endosymbiont GvMRE of Glomus versiforme]|uniref:hypothetical protein n=1 Tax=endosymbiont GvMRE of Glomus versiforme TaxID=2039283 RepID=UPI000ED08CD7|nr:hypothetical protein [endosymbiont GvMRE of Glomus versiforme]RHZ35847.1 hypothetical protein GvMRE_Ic4g26 [endosymbiont GvMRE of Glomus versiforme]
MKIALKANSNTNKNLSKQQPEKVSRLYKIKATIRGKERIWLEVSYHYKKRNCEYLKGCRKRGVRPDPNRLFNNKVIRDMVQQLHRKELENKKPNYFAFRGVIDSRNNWTYTIIIKIDEKFPKLVSFINLLYLSKKKKKINNHIIKNSL